jgi:hypothetical protein
MAALQRERDALDTRGRELQRRLSKRPASAPPLGQPLEALLEARGLTGPESVAALQRLLGERTRELLDALEITSAEALTELLDQRLILSCGRGACADVRGATLLEVPPERCEICGNSDAGRAFHGFARACRSAGIHKVVIVGGSPAYRKALKDLAAPGRRELRVELVDGKARHREKKIRGLARGADLVLIWGATILDHATSNAFEASGARTLTIPHRGISTMLSAAATRVRGAL